MSRGYGGPQGYGGGYDPRDPGGHPDGWSHPDQDYPPPNAPRRGTGPQPGMGPRPGTNPYPVMPGPPGTRPTRRPPRPAMDPGPGPGAGPVRPRPPQPQGPPRPPFGHPDYQPARSSYGGGHDGGDSWDADHEDASWPGADYDDRDSRDGMPVPKKKRRRLARWIAALVILAPILGAGLYGYNLYMSKFHPPDYPGSGTGPGVTVVVKPGDNASSIAPRLAQLGVVESSRAFVLAAEHSASTAGLEPGTYRIDRHMKAALAYAAMLDPKNRVQVTLAVPEGLRAAQIVAALAKNLNVPAAEFNSIKPEQLGLPSYADGKAEGFLWPATYSIQPKAKPLQVLRSMVGKFNQVAQEQNLAAAASARGLSMRQLMIEASLVQAEGNRPYELPKIARVIANRLNRNMPLQFDSVLEYGQNRFAVNIQNSWARIPGPYNDFQNRGLPPTPICNPGLDAIEAVLHPAPGNWLYFLAFPNGTSEFSATPLKGMT